MDFFSILLGTLTAAERLIASDDAVQRPDDSQATVARRRPSDSVIDMLSGTVP